MYWVFVTTMMFGVVVGDWVSLPTGDLRAVEEVAVEESACGLLITTVGDDAGLVGVVLEEGLELELGLVVGLGVEDEEAGVELPTVVVGLEAEEGEAGAELPTVPVTVVELALESREGLVLVGVEVPAADCEEVLVSLFELDVEIASLF